MFQTIVTTAKADAWGTLPDGRYHFPTVDTMPTYADVAGMLIEAGIKTITVRHVFLGRTVARLDNEVGEIVEVS